MSEAVTEGVRVTVQSRFHPERSDPQRRFWFFSYEVTIANEGELPVRLESRHWVITDGRGHVEEVRGPGVIGQQPIIAPGDSHRYVSACPLQTAMGVMEGSYHMLRVDGTRFDARIAPFALTDPSMEH